MLRDVEDGEQAITRILHRHLGTMDYLEAHRDLAKILVPADLMRHFAEYVAVTDSASETPSVATGLRHEVCGRFVEGLDGQNDLLSMALAVRDHHCGEKSSPSG